MIKVVHIISSMARGGRERQLATIVSQTDQIQFPSRILFFNKPSSSYLEEYDLMKHSIYIKEKGKLARLKAVYRALKAENPDIVFSWGNGESITAMLLSPFHKYKFINGSIRHGIRSKKNSHYLRTLVLQVSPNIVANSFAGIKANNLKRGQVLYNGISSKFIGQMDQKDKKLKIEKLVPKANGRILLVSVANLVPYKDYFSTLDALKELHHEGYDFHYLILGEGRLRKDIEERIEEYGLSDRIELPGNVQNVNEYLKVADIFIHSSKGEGCSNAILEAMGTGLPVVASNTGGTPEIVKEVNGLLFDFKNSEQLKKHLKVYLDDNEKRNSAGKESLKIVEEGFTIDKMMENYYSILRNLHE